MQSQRLIGTGVALVTPFRKDGKIDFPALEKIIEHVISGGIDYLVSLGTTGETPTLSADEKVEIVQFTLEKANNRLPVVVGIGGNNTREIIHLLETYPLDKVEAVLSVSPYYSKPSAEGLYQHYKAIAKASPKPVILYNVPARTGRTIPAAVTVRLANDFENIIAVKEASGDMTQCMQIIRDAPDDFMVVSGDDMLSLSQMSIGMQGLVSVGANYFAHDLTNMIHAALKNEYEEARRLHYKMMKGFELMFAENNPAGIKAILSVAGLCENNLRLPVVPVSDELLKQIEFFMKNY